MSSPYEYTYGYCSVCGHYNDPTRSVCNCANKELLKAPPKSLWFTCPKCNQQYPPNSFHSCWSTPPDAPPSRPAEQVGGTHRTNDAGETTSTSISDTLAQRGNRYGSFSTHSEISQALQDVLFHAKSRADMPAYTSEAITLICHKLARVVNGDHTYDDNFRDIAGYAQLVVDILNGKDT